MKNLKTLLIVALIFICSTANAQMMVRIAGTGVCDTEGNGGPAKDATICAPWGMTMDSSSNIYLNNLNYNVIQKIAANGIIGPFAGNGTWGNWIPGTDDGIINGALADTTPFENVMYMCTDRNNNILVSLAWGLVVQISTSGIITVVAGNDTGCAYTEGVQATTVSLGPISAITTDKENNIYIAHADLMYGSITNCYISKVTPAGIITRYAGLGTLTANGTPARQAIIDQPLGLITDDADNLYVSCNDSFIVKIDNKGIYSFYGGNGTDPADGARISDAAIYPHALAFSPDGELYFAERNNAKIRKISKAGIVTTVAGDGAMGYSGDSTVAATSHTNSPNDIIFDKKGNLYFDEEYPDGSMSMVFKVILNPLDVPETPSVGYVTISPNPSTGVFNVTTTAQQTNTRVVVFNNMGQLVATQKIAGNAAQVNLKKMPDGIYFARVMNETGAVITTEKLVKME
jgi:hypothetical protein